LLRLVLFQLHVYIYYICPSVKENGKEYGGVEVLKVYPHNRQCTTPYKHLTYAKMQTIGTCYDLFQFNKEVMLGTLLKDLLIICMSFTEMTKTQASMIVLFVL
jgi:hypothetical protein